MQLILQRNWKEDQAKAERKKVDGQSKFQVRYHTSLNTCHLKMKKRKLNNSILQQKWKRHQGHAEMDEVEDKPKGLVSVLFA